MTAALALLTLRECLRRPMPYLAVAAIVALTSAGQILHISAFGAGATEAANLALSAVLLSGLAFTALVGTSLIRLDVERGTLALLLSQPLTSERYVVARFLGLAVSSILVGLLAAAAAAGSLALAGAPHGTLSSALLLGWTRVALALVVLSAGALAVSAATSRMFAPVLLLVIFLAADIVPSSAATRLFPDFALFGLDADGAPTLPWLSLYAMLYSVVFLIVAYLLLILRAPTRTGS